MRVMCHHHSRFWLELCRKFPERTGWLVGPTWWSNPPEGVAFALDNDAFQTFTKGTPYDFDAWMRFLDKVSSTGRNPIWALVPDVVGDARRTREQWFIYSHYIKDRRWKTALAVQDGMNFEDVKACNPDLIFVGGTTQWKWSTAHEWCFQSRRPVHIGRVRSRRLLYCQQIGAESCDGSGWFRESVRGRPARQLEAWLENPEPHPELNLT